jgi:hypothetical protein
MLHQASTWRSDDAREPSVGLSRQRPPAVGHDSADGRSFARN